MTLAGFFWNWTRTTNQSELIGEPMSDAREIDYQRAPGSAKRGRSRGGLGNRHAHGLSAPGAGFTMSFNSTVTDLEPSAAAGAVCQCGAGPHPKNTERCAAGHLLRGNGAALVTGAQSRAFWRQHAEAKQEIVSAILTDLGATPEDAPRALLIAVQSVAQAQLVRDSAYARLVEAGGPLSSGGKVRRAFMVWLSSMDRLERHLRLVGLERKTKPINPLDALRLAVEEANRE